MNTPKLRRIITEGYDLLESAVRLATLDRVWLTRAKDAAAEAERGYRRHDLLGGRCVYNIGIEQTAMSLVTVGVVDSLRCHPDTPSTWAKVADCSAWVVNCHAVAEKLRERRGCELRLPEHVQQQADLRLVMQKMLTHVSGNVDHARDIAC